MFKIPLSSCLSYDPFLLFHLLFLDLDMSRITQHFAQGSAADPVNPSNSDPTWKHCNERSLGMGGAGSDELCIIYNIECTAASAFQKVPLQLHWIMETILSIQLAMSLPVYTSIEDICWKGGKKIISWPFSSGYRVCYKTKSNTCSEGGR